VVRVGRLVVVGHVAGDTIRRQFGGLFVVALAARYGRVRPGKRESRLRMIELRACPLSRRVAARTIGREAGSGVVGTGGLVEILQMAAGAIHRRTGESIVGVALIARHTDVSPRESELGCRVVIELRARP
jgi:hypothetical protein